MPRFLTLKSYTAQVKQGIAQHAPAFWLWHLVLPLLIGLLLWKSYPATGWDDLVEHWYYDPATRSFPLRDAVWMTAGMHTGLKLLVIALGMMVLGTWIATFFNPELRAERRRLAWIWLAMLIASQLVGLLKSQSIHHCPWDVIDYGGYAPHLALFDILPAGITPGRCFPGGHAAAGFVLMALYFGLRHDRPCWARWSLVGALVMGSIMGWSQTMRGAHFVSHTLWSAWVVWFVLLAGYLLFPVQLSAGGRRNKI